MDLSNIRAPKGSSKRRKRLGRGSGSGHGKTSGKGNKGTRARSGSYAHLGFEGGQMQLTRILPKRGFRRRFKTVYQIVNLEKLAKFAANSVIDANELQKKGMIKNIVSPVKILGEGDIDKALTLKVNAISDAARKKIEKAGGKVEIVTSNH